MSKFAINIKRLRKDKKLTQSQLATKLGIARSTISLYETGRRFPSIPILRKISVFFEISLDQLIGSDFELNSNQKIELLAASEKDSDYLID